MKEMTLDERMDYAARRKKEMNCCQAVLVAFADKPTLGVQYLANGVVRNLICLC